MKLFNDMSVGDYTNNGIYECMHKQKQPAGVNNIFELLSQNNKIGLQKL